MTPFDRRPGSTGGRQLDKRRLIGGAAALVLAVGAGFGLARLTARSREPAGRACIGNSNSPNDSPSAA